MRIILKPFGIVTLLLTITTLGFLAFRATSPDTTTTTTTTTEKITAKTPPNRSANKGQSPSSNATVGNLAENGAMTQLGEEGRPAGWGQVWTGKGGARAFWDTTDFHTAPASLCLNTRGSAAHASTNLFLRGSLKGGQKITLSGFAKCKGRYNYAGIALRCLDANGQQIEWLTVHTLENSGEWHPFEQTVTLPLQTTRAELILVGEGGEGSLGLDDIVIQ